MYLIIIKCNLWNPKSGTLSAPKQFSKDNEFVKSRTTLRTRDLISVWPARQTVSRASSHSWLKTSFFLLNVNANILVNANLTLCTSQMKMFARSMKAWNNLSFKGWRNKSKLLPLKMLLPIPSNRVRSCSGLLISYKTAINIMTNWSKLSEFL